MPSRRSTSPLRSARTSGGWPSSSTRRRRTSRCASSTGPGTPEGIITAAAIRCMGGAIQAQLAPKDDAERQRAVAAGYDLDQVLTTEDLVSSENVFFCATGVTDGDLLKGVRYYGGGCTTQSIVMRSKSGTVRMIEAYHRLSKLNEYSAIDFTGDSSAAHPLP